MKEIPTFQCIDGHTCGNPVRLVVSGHPDLKGENIAEKRLDFLERFDWIRTGLMFEPRGHDMMSGSFIYPPDNPNHDASILFIETSGCLPMCGHGTIGTITFAIETGVIVPKNEGIVLLEAPAGLIRAEYGKEGDKVKWVKLVNIPSFLHSTGHEVECPELGPLKIDVAFGGNFYGIIEPQENYKDLSALSASQITTWSPELRRQLDSAFKFEHPLRSDICGLTHIMWTGKPLNEDSHARNAVFYGEKAIDRSPCGTGTSARMAHLYAKGELKVGDDFIHESFIGSQFVGRVEEETNVGDYKAIVPSIRGWALRTGESTITLDPADPFVKGFTVK